MTSFLHRLISGVRVGWASSTAFATLGTAFTMLLALPLLDILFDVLMGADLSSPDLVRTGYAAALIALASSVCSGIVSSVAADRNLGIFKEVHTRRRFDGAYWLSVAAVPTLLATLTGAAAIGAVFTLSPLHDGALLVRVVPLAGVAVVCGILMGIGAAGIGVDLPDPYLGATMVGALLPILTGVIVPTSTYPSWLRIASALTPMSGALRVIDGVDTVAAPLAGDIAISALWASAGIAFTRHAVLRLRSGRRHDVI